MSPNYPNHYPNNYNKVIFFVLKNYSYTFYFVIVKLREREGQRVDLGRSLKGHL